MRNKDTRSSILIKISVFVVLLCVIAAGVHISQGLQKKKKAWQQLEDSILQECSNFSVEPFLYIQDLKTGWRITINEDKKLPAASLVKLPIMVACLQSLEKGTIEQDFQIALDSKDKVGGSGILKNMPSGKKFTVDELIGLMITKSDNTATNMLIGIFGFDFLNEYFKKIGLGDTNIDRLMMDMKARSSGIENYTTASDMGFILERIYKGRMINKHISSRCVSILKEQKSKDRIPAKLPKGTIVAHKTGLERHVCHDAGIVFGDDGRDFIICALTKHNNRNSWPSKMLIARISVLVYNHINKDH
jgi:beta-lactamase class A